ncbi:hypothetical protein HN873_012583, partial [Arachis hypogaea]
ISSEEAIETAKQLMLKEGLFVKDAEDERETFLVDEDDEDNDGNGNAIGEWGYLCNLNSFGSGEHRHKGRTSEEQKNKDRTSEEHRRLQILEPKSRVDIGSNDGFLWLNWEFTQKCCKQADQFRIAPIPIYSPGNTVFHILLMSKTRSMAGKPFCLRRLRKSSIEAALFQKYDEEMSLLDRISAQKLEETEYVRSMEASPRSISERICIKCEEESM